MTPLLVTKYGIGRREWSIFDLIRLLTNESGIETDDHMFTQTPITFRRIKSPTEKLAKYDSLTVKGMNTNCFNAIKCCLNIWLIQSSDDDDLSQHIKAFEINDTDEKHVTGGLSDESKVEEDVDQEQQVAQPKQAELTKEQLGLFNCLINQMFWRFVWQTSEANESGSPDESIGWALTAQT